MAPLAQLCVARGVRIQSVEALLRRQYVQAARHTHLASGTAPNTSRISATTGLTRREVSRHLGLPVEFMPHVAPHFRGITMTVNLWLQQPAKVEEIRALYRERYADEPHVHVMDEAPWVSRIAGRHGAEVGGFTLSADGRRLVVVATLDNLLKGAATQALQNLNLAFGLPETMGIPT